jgi:hypothetical protein
MKNTTAIGVYKLTLLGYASYQVRTVNGTFTIWRIL